MVNGVSNSVKNRQVLCGVPLGSILGFFCFSFILKTNCLVQEGHLQATQRTHNVPCHKFLVLQTEI